MFTVSDEWLMRFKEGISRELYLFCTYSIFFFFCQTLPTPTCGFLHYHFCASLIPLSSFIVYGTLNAHSSLYNIRETDNFIYTHTHYICQHANVVLIQQKPSDDEGNQFFLCPQRRGECRLASHHFCVAATVLYCYYYYYGMRCTHWDCK